MNERAWEVNTARTHNQKARSARSADLYSRPPLVQPEPLSTRVCYRIKVSNVEASSASSRLMCFSPLLPPDPRRAADKQHTRSLPLLCMTLR